MKILNVNEVCGYIAPKYNTYQEGLVESYIGDCTDHLFLNFALEDRIVQRILNKYSSSSDLLKERLERVYSNRVGSLITEDFQLKEAASHEKIPSLELSSDKETPGYIVCMSGNKSPKFKENGSRIFVPREFYKELRIIRRAEFGQFAHKRVSGFYYVPDEIKGFTYYIITRNPDEEGNYYVEKYIVDYKTRRDKMCASLKTQNEYEELMEKEKLKEI